MSLDAMVWAVKDAPVANSEEHSVLTVMADEADEAGCGVWLSQATIAERARVSDRDVRRRLRELEERGLIARGDQSMVSHIPAYKRPVVYDLLIPFTWFGNVRRVNRSRSEKGQDLITAESRPEIAPPPPRKPRADAGRIRSPQGEARTTSPGVGRTSSPGDNGRTAKQAGLLGTSDRTTRSDREDWQSDNPVTNPVTNPKTGSLTSFETRAVADDSRLGRQPTLTGEDPDPEPAEPSPRDRSFGVARGWIEHRKTRGVPVVVRGKADPLHALRALLEPFAEAGYTDDELKHALADVGEGVPSSAQLDRALVARRSGTRIGRQPGRMTGANRHIDSLTPEQRRDRNPFRASVGATS